MKWRHLSLLVLGLLAVTIAAALAAEEGKTRKRAKQRPRKEVKALESPAVTPATAESPEAETITFVVPSPGNVNLHEYQVYIRVLVSEEVDGDTAVVAKVIGENEQQLENVLYATGLPNEYAGLVGAPGAQQAPYPEFRIEVKADLAEPLSEIERIEIGFKGVAPVEDPGARSKLTMEHQTLVAPTNGNSAKVTHPSKGDVDVEANQIVVWVETTGDVEAGGRAVRARVIRLSDGQQYSYGYLLADNPSSNVYKGIIRAPSSEDGTPFRIVAEVDFASDGQGYEEFPHCCYKGISP